MKNKSMAPKSKSTDPKTDASEMYKKYTQIEHMLERPGMYIGSVDNTVGPRWIIHYNPDDTSTVANEDAEEISTVSSTTNLRSKIKVDYRNATYNPGLEQCIIELIANAVDHSQRCLELPSKYPDQVTKIEIECTDTYFSIKNNGTGIPIEIHKEHGIYIPEMIFGSLLTSSNYDDSVERTWVGTNGIGAKAANIFSKEFIVELVTNGTKYIQKFSNNLSEKTVPVITKHKVKDYVKITFYPDFKRFNMKGLQENDNKLIIEKRIYDASAVTPKNVSIYFNDFKIPVKDFKDYVSLYLPYGSKKILYEEPSGRWSVAFAVNPFDKATQISLVNGAATEEGGTHVDHVFNPVVKKVIEVISESNKAKKEGFDIKPQYVKDNLIVFIKCNVINPSYNSQLKTKLETPSKKFGSTCTIPDDIVVKISKLGIIDNIIALAHAKETQIFNKVTKGTKRSRLVDVPKLYDANLAGTKDSHKCTLILTEGDSGQGTALAGISVFDKGRDTWGVFPLKGKLLNIKGATLKKLNSNEELININKILGLSEGLKDPSKLRYGKVMCLADSDFDGFHIKGLLVNYFTHYWPEIVEQGFLTSLLTPIVKVFKNSKETLNFYNMNDYNDFVEKNKRENGPALRIKYYKGLGTSNREEAREYFKNILKNQIEYSYKKSRDGIISTDDDRITLAFNKEYADERKEWILGSLKNMKDLQVDYTKKKVSISNFINKELIQFSIYDNQRSLPNIIDGFKPSQRKVLYGSFLKKLFTKKQETKVAQLGSYISEKTEYHHGEVSLHDTITKMAQDFVGCGNAPLFVASGNFGSRKSGGADAASPRYIFTYMKEWVPLVYNILDNSLLDYNVEDNHIIEPVKYVPIIPMILVNGSLGIGTGWSCDIPCFKPSDIINNIEVLIRNNGEAIISNNGNGNNGNGYRKLQPWYRGFKGSIVEISENKWVTKGVYTRKGRNVKITELPIGLWTDVFNEKIIKNESIIKNVNADHTDDIKIYYDVDLENDLTDDEVIKILKLESSISATNMVGFDSFSQIVKFKNVDDMVMEFYKCRVKLYEKRYTYIEQVLLEKINFVSEKERFISLVVSDKLVIFKKKKEEIIKLLTEHNFKKLSDPNKVSKEESQESSEESQESQEGTSQGSFNYLLHMRISLFTQDEIDKLHKELLELKERLRYHKSITHKDLWLQDLAELKKYSEFSQ